MDFLAALDQMQSMLKDLSPVLWKYYQALVKQGFTEVQAFELTKDMQNNLTRANGGK